MPMGIVVWSKHHHPGDMQVHARSGGGERQTDIILDTPTGGCGHTYLCGRYRLWVTIYDTPEHATITEFVSNTQAIIVN